VEKPDESMANFVSRERRGLALKAIRSLRSGVK
jgi:hypothetical protein